MTTGEGNQTTGALHRLRQRWFSPSRPLAVDDLPHWHPPSDPEGDQPEREPDSGGSAPTSATS
jgi:hypothetical protein